MRNHGNTYYLWRVLLNLIYVFVIGIILLLIYIPLKPHFETYRAAPKYSKEQLDKFAQKRSSNNDGGDRVENGIHLATGLAYDHNFKHIQASCISCHSPKLISQNRATREGWQQMIVWMQETQGLPDLGARETKILDYLSTHYAPKEMGRRPNLDMEEIEWYILEMAE